MVAGAWAASRRTGFGEALLKSAAAVETYQGQAGRHSASPVGVSEADAAVVACQGHACGSMEADPIGATMAGQEGLARLEPSTGAIVVGGADGVAQTSAAELHLAFGHDAWGAAAVGSDSGCKHSNENFEGPSVGEPEFQIEFVVTRGG